MSSESLVFAGRSVARGIGIGNAICLFGGKRQFFRSRIEANGVESEIRRLNEACGLAVGQLTEIAGSSDAGEGQAGIFETHRLFLEDRSLLKRIESTIRGDQVNSEWAVSNVIEEYSAKYRNLSDKHLREKYIDLEDVGERLIAALGGKRETEIDVNSNSIVVAKVINPSTLIEIAASKPVGLVTEEGGWTSHTFILARELGIPAVTGIAKLMRRVETGDRIVVDGDNGLIVVNPSNSKLERYTGQVLPTAEVDEVSGGVAAPFVETTDKQQIRICANLDLAAQPVDLERIAEFGIGLYRSEYLFQRYSGYPGEEEQFLKYKEVLKLAGDTEVKIRTFDLNLGETLDGSPIHEKNPALGMRGIRLSLQDESPFRVQIRALLRAGAGRNLGIVVPMISDVSELIRVKAIIAEEKMNLEDAGFEAGAAGFGTMIEIPAAVFQSRHVFEIVDFVNVGTNDLVQYLLAVDRDNDSVAGYFRTLHPAVIAALRIIFENANKSGKPAIVCGEMAGAPLYVPLLIGLGARTLSMNLGSTARISDVISKISAIEAKEIAFEAAECRTADDAENLIRQRYREKWPDISSYFSQNSIRN